MNLWRAKTVQSWYRSETSLNSLTGNSWSNSRKLLKASNLEPAIAAVEASPFPRSRADKPSTVAEGEKPIRAPPIAFRWDVSKEGSARTLHFPISETQSPNSTKGTLFNELVRSCSPVTFGREDKDILDESYRRAGKLDRSQFSVDFHPHDYGIVDAIS